MPTADEWIVQLRNLTGGEQRLRVLAILAEHDTPIYHEDIRDTFTTLDWNFHPTGLSKVLRELETDGYITGDVPQDRRRGRAVRYTLNRDAINKVFNAARTGLRLDQDVESR